MSMTYREALELTAEIYDTNVLNIENALTNAGADYTVENLQKLWNEYSVAGSKTRIVQKPNGEVFLYEAETVASIGTNPIDSNTSLQGAMKVPVNTTVTEVPPTPKSPVTFKVGMREAGKFAVNEVAPAIMAAGWGITVGKTIDNVLYNAFPDFWDSVGMGAMDPDTWGEIITPDGEGNALFNAIFGIDPDTGETQAYLEDTAAAYLAMYLNEKGVFANGTEMPTNPTYTANTVISSISTASIRETIESIKQHTSTLNTSCAKMEQQIAALGYSDDDYIQFELLSTNNSIRAKLVKKENIIGKTVRSVGTLEGGVKFQYNLTVGVPCHTISVFEANRNNIVTSGYTDHIANGRYNYSGTWSAFPASNMGVKMQPPGIGTQDGAVVPTGTDNWTDINNTKQSLQNQYPDLWNNAKHYDIVNDDGTTTTKTYIPVNIPKATSKNDTKPTSGNQKQNKPQTDPQSDPDIQDLITQLITTLTPTNIPDTGSGDTPVVPVPTGSASSLWKIYNPTQAQVDAFGAWLWNSSFVDQIKRLFNDPMQGIIGIHKVFATPSIGGSATIKVGYLDSEISSAWIDNQYTTVDCGTVNLREQFGNVFDYAPYTKLQLYLPFIGIVDLDISDVMRGSISVIYHVDVLTGACLADVKVNRDGSGGILYQFTGSAIVTYPISSGSYLGVIAGVGAIATGAVATIMTGGLAGAALGVAGTASGLSHLHANVNHSGNFSGSAGAMGGKKPYLIISRPQTAMAGSFEHYTGLPANSHVTISDCSGYIKVKSVYVGGIPRATEDEKNMIEAQLKAGVLV